MATIDDLVKEVKELKKQQEEIHETVNEVATVLKGYNGYPGLCQRHEDLSKDHYSLRRLVIGLICILVGTGVISGSTFGILKLVGA